MSLIGKRAEFAAALSAVAGCRGYEKRPAAPNIGDAWPVMGPGDRASGTAFTVTWGIRVVVPDDEYAAAEWWDAHWPPLFYALEPVCSVQRFEPVVLAAQGGDISAVQITVIAEE